MLKMITLLMKKYTKLFALMGFALLTGACQNDNLIPEAPALPGDEIVFGATAYFENGEPQTRTVYGDVAGNQIEVRWVPNKDYIDIACPEAVGSQNSEYMVSGTTSGETGSGVADNYSASVLVRQSPVGLQWSTAGTHHFYATYPSAEQIRKDVGVSLTDAEKSALGMKLENNNAILTGFLPVDQSPINIPTDTKTVDGMTGYVVEPNMTYAYMVAKESVNTSNTRGNVGLEFSSQVTALEFQIVASAITGENPQGLKDITILGVQLYSKSGQDIAGHFTYDFETGNFEDANQHTGYEKVTQTFGDGLTISANTGFISTTFFLSPKADFTLSGDFRLTVIYKIGNSPMVKTATIKKNDIQAKKKYFFKNVKLPAHDASVNASAWFSALNPATWISQVSIPVAANAFTSYYSGTESKFIKQQVKNYEELWNLGVRGFEFMTSASNTSTNLGTEKFVANGAEITTTGAPDFNTAFRTLYGHLKKNPGETLVIVATYKSYGGDTGGNYTKYNPQTYITHLENYLTSFWNEVQADYEGKKENLFVKLGTNSRVADLRNKIAIVIRPGDDEYNKHVNGTNATYGVSDNWVNNVALIKNWGTGVDQWDKRYGSGYYCEGVYSYSNSGKSVIEDNIPFKASSSSGELQEFETKNKFTGDESKFNNPLKKGYSLNIDGGGTAYMQCWERVSPTSAYIYSGKTDEKYYLGFSGWNINYATIHLYIQWKESLREKKLMIADVLTQSRATKGSANSNTLYINSLASYFITTELPESTWPYFSGDMILQEGINLGFTQLADTRFSFTDQGKGGDWASCTAELNYLMWSELNAPEAEGPMGLVMLNYIGAETTDFDGITPISMAVTGNTASQASKELPLKIMLNNFIFPLSTDENYKDPDEDPEPPIDPETPQDPEGGDGEA